MADEVERLRRVNGEWGLVMGVLIDGLAERNIKLPLGHRCTEVALAEIDRLRVQRDDYMVDLGVKIAERDTLATRLEAAEKVVEAADEFVEFWRFRPEFEEIAGRRWSSLRAALHAYRTHEPEPPKVSSPCPVCGEDDWPVGGVHAARRIHELDQHEGDPRIEPRWRPKRPEPEQT